MPRQKGTEKTGGRQKGTPNKTTAAVKGCITEALNNYMLPQTEKGGTQPNLQADLEAMTPEDRLRAIIQLAGYVIPKQQALTIDEQKEIEADALAQWVETAPDEAINAVADKILEKQLHSIKKAI